MICWSVDSLKEAITSVYIHHYHHAIGLLVNRVVGLRHRYFFPSLASLCCHTTGTQGRGGVWWAGLVCPCVCVCVCVWGTARVRAHLALTGACSSQPPPPFLMKEKNTDYTKTTFLEENIRNIYIYIYIYIFIYNVFSPVGVQESCFPMSQCVFFHGSL